MTNVSADSIAPDARLIEQLAHGTVTHLPEVFRHAATMVALRIEDFPPAEIMEAMQIDDPFDLTGLYEGIPMTEKSVMDQPQHPDVIWLFRRAILDEWAERGDVSIGELVSHVLIHEFAHHFGWSDDDIARIDPWWE